MTESGYSVCIDAELARTFNAILGLSLIFYKKLNKYFMIQFQNEFVIAELVNNSSAILLTWKGFIPSTNYRETLEKSLNIAKKQNIKNWISDIRLMRVVGIKDQEWAGTEWVSKAVLAGCYKKQAVIMPEDVFGQASAKNMITTATIKNQQIEIQNFTRLEDAKKWLE